MTRERCRRESGSAGLAVLAVAAGIGLLGLFAAVLGTVAVARHSAAAAADLAALGAAESMAAGPQAACRQAARLATAMGVALAECRPGPPGAVLVVVQARPWRAQLLGRTVLLPGPRVTARAG